MADMPSPPLDRLIDRDECGQAIRQKMVADIVL
jgi:hypothetical protein